MCFVKEDLIIRVGEGSCTARFFPIPSVIIGEKFDSRYLLPSCGQRKGSGAGEY